MDFHPRGNDVGRVAKVREPHILDVKVVESLGKARSMKTSRYSPLPEAYLV